MPYACKTEEITMLATPLKNLRIDDCASPGYKDIA